MEKTNDQAGEILFYYRDYPLSMSIYANHYILKYCILDVLFPLSLTITLQIIIISVVIHSAIIMEDLAKSGMTLRMIIFS